MSELFRKFVLQDWIDDLSESSHDRLNRYLLVLTVVVSIPLSFVTVPYIAGLILLFY